MKKRIPCPAADPLPGGGAAACHGAGRRGRQDVSGPGRQHHHGYAPGGAAVAKPFADQVAAQYGYTLVNQAEDGETTASLLQKLEAQEIDLSGATW